MRDRTPRRKGLKPLTAIAIPREVQVADESQYDPNSNKKYCPSCGREIDVQAEYCPYCGTRVGHSPTPIPPPKTKSEALAVILSVLLPGLGQVYNGQITKGILVIILAVILGILFGLFCLTAIASMALWFWSIFDAYDTARRINQGLIRT